MFSSIQSRLSIGLFLSLLGIFFIFWLLISFGMQKVAENYMASRLQHDLDTLLSAVDFSEKGGLELKRSRVNPIYDRPYSGHYYALEFNGKLYRSRSLWDQELKILPKEQIYTLMHKFGLKKQLLLIISKSYSKQGKQLRITLAEDLTDIINNIKKLQTVFVFMALIALSILLIIQLFILKRGLKPLHDIKTNIHQLKKGKIDIINQPDVEEIKPLVEEINHLLFILNQRIKRSRNALSDLSHAIKKPLTVMRQLSNNEQSDNSLDIRKTMDSQINTIQHLTDRILKQARLSARGHSGELFNVATEIPAIIKMLTIMYPNKKLDIQTNYQGNMAPILDREDMLELLGNLLDNAFKWAEHKIMITVNKKQDKWQICIEDDGPGCENDFIKELTRRGSRIDENVNGYGFGLAIVNDIIEAYNGEIIISRSEKIGGFKVIVKI